MVPGGQMDPEGPEAQMDPGVLEDHPDPEAPEVPEGPEARQQPQIYFRRKPVVPAQPSPVPQHASLDGEFRHAPNSDGYRIHLGTKRMTYLNLAKGS